MRVKMLVQISGTYAGEVWPEAGGVVDLPTDEAEKQIWLGNAAAVEKAVPADDAEKAVAGGAETAVPEEKSETRDAPAATIRAWAKEHGLDVPARGAIPAEIADLYYETQE